MSSSDSHEPLTDEDRHLLDRYVQAFQRYDLESLTSLIREDATQSMPPYDLWLQGRDDIFTWWFGPGIGCRGSRVLPVIGASGCPAFGQYKPSANGGYDPWALQVVELSGGRIAELTFFLDTERLFPLWGLPARLESQHFRQAGEPDQVAEALADIGESKLYVLPRELPPEPGEGVHLGQVCFGEP